MSRYSPYFVWLALVAAFPIGRAAAQTADGCVSMDVGDNDIRFVCEDFCGTDSIFVAVAAYSADQSQVSTFCSGFCADGTEITAPNCQTAFLAGDVATLCQECTSGGPSITPPTDNSPATSPTTSEDCYGKGTYKEDDGKSGKKKGKKIKKGKKCKNSPKEPHPEKVGKGKHDEGKGGKGKGYSVDDDSMVVKPPVTSIPPPQQIPTPTPPEPFPSLPTEPFPTMPTEPFPSIPTQLPPVVPIPEPFPVAGPDNCPIACESYMLPSDCNTDSRCIGPNCCLVKTCSSLEAIPCGNYPDQSSCSAVPLCDELGCCGNLPV